MMQERKQWLTIAGCYDYPPSRCCCNCISYCVCFFFDPFLFIYEKKTLAIIHVTVYVLDGRKPGLTPSYDDMMVNTTLLSV